MKIEHFALNVPDPINMANWYASTVGLTLVKKVLTAPFIHFLADSNGSVLLELYNNTKAPILNYANMDPLVVHLAFVSSNPIQDKTKLLEAGASLVSEQVLEDGSHIIMLRDPWGLAIQLCKRANPMLTEYELPEKTNTERD
jgi:glyoxylase I family protein